MTFRLATAALAMMALPLAGCVQLGETPPASLMTLTAATPLAAGTGRTVDPARAVQVGVPLVPASLNNLRVPVRASDTALAYLKDARWAEPPNRLFRNLVAEVVEVRTGRPVLDPRETVVVAGVRLGGTLAAFGLDAPTNVVIVTFDATLARGEAAIEERRFEARVPVSAPTADAVAPALNQAANQVANDVADWLGR